MDGTADDENTQGGGTLPVTPQHYPGHLNPVPFSMQAAYQQAAAAAFGLQGGFNGLMPPSDPRLSTFPPAQMGTVPPFNFSHGLPTPGETPGSRGKRPRVDHGDGIFNTDAADGAGDGELLERFQKLHEDHDVLRQRVDALEAALSAGERETVTSTEDTASKRIPELEQLGHEYAFQLMGVTKKRSPTSNTSTALDSVEAPEMAPVSHLDYILPDSGGYLAGNPELKIPNWEVPSPNSNTDNVKFQQAILQLIKNNNKATVEERGWSDDVIMQRVKSAFKTFIGHYKKQTNANAREKAQIKEATQGYQQLIQKGAMSSDNETPGEAEKDAWMSKAAELRGTGNISVWETHRLLWRDVKLVKFYYALDRIAFEDLKATVNSQRFHGFKENDNENAPKRTAKNWKLYDCMVSKRWAKANHDNTPTIPNPLGYSGDLSIDDGELFPADHDEIKLLESYYGDDEMED
ncbi:hypothetical protein H1R20_g7675, partial [Candolleomyces eurysporus]